MITNIFKELKESKQMKDLALKTYKFTTDQIKKAFGLFKIIIK